MLMQILDSFGMAVQLHLAELNNLFQQRLDATPPPQALYSVSEADPIMNLDETNHVAPDAAPIAVEKVPGGVQNEARRVVGVQRTQSHQPAARDLPRRSPICGLQI